MLNDPQILNRLNQIGALISGTHVIYTSGKHGSAYFNKDAIYPHTELTSLLCAQMAQAWKDTPIDAVLAPALGGIILSQWTAFHLSILLKKEVLGVYAEKEGESFAVRRGYDDLIRNKDVLLVEDVLTTGGSIGKVVELVRHIPCNVVGVSALCNRGKVGTQALGNIPRLASLIEISLEAWDPPDCPMCKKGMPVNTKVGKGKK